MIILCFKFNPDFLLQIQHSEEKKELSCLYKHMEINDKWTETSQYIY